MIDFHILFDDLLGEKDISLTELVTYGSASVGAMSTLNPAGVFTPRINATQAALASVESNTSDAGVKLALQKGATQNKNQFREELPAKMAKVHAKVVGQYGKNGSEVTVCFPEGLSVFGKCRDEQLENKLQVTLAGITAHQAQLGAPLVAEVGGYLSSWLVLFAASTGAKNAKKSSSLSLGQLRKVLQIELTKNALFVAFTYPEDHGKCDYYLPQHLLQNPEAQPPGPATLSGEGGAGQVSLTGDAPGAEVVRYFYRLGTAGAFTDAGTGEPEGEFVITGLASGGIYEVKARGENAQGNGSESEVLTLTVA